MSDHHQRLVRMANQIAGFMRSRPPGLAVDGLAGPVNDFWNPRMRGQLLDLIAAGDAGLDAMVVDARDRIRPPPLEG